MKTLLARCTRLALLGCLCLPAVVPAQSTLADPYPLAGDQARAAAANAALNAQLDRHGGGTRITPQEQARRRAHGDQLSACNTRVRERFPPGARKAARAECRATFQAQRATWNSASRPRTPGR